jgi:hypothetical protein
MFLATPPPSDSAFTPPEVIGDEANPSSCVSISTAFSPSENRTTDVMLLSSDSVFFFVHSATLLIASSNSFNHMLPPAVSNEPVVTLDDPSDVINVLLHAIYNMDMTHYAPTFNTLSSVLPAFQKYGYTPLHKFINPTSPLHSLYSTYAASRPIETYALAAQYDLSSLAKQASSSLLSFELSALTDDVCTQMGPLYLKKLFFLHLGRTERLKSLLSQSPTLSPSPMSSSPRLPTPPTPTFTKSLTTHTAPCDVIDRKRLLNTWNIATAQLARDAHADTSMATIEKTLGSIADEVVCEACKIAVRERIRALVVDWNTVKRTI